jgi:hypothetical protein
MLTWRMLSEILRNASWRVNYSLIESLRKNKVLYLAGLINEELRHTEEWRELSRRKKLQANALIEFADIAENLGIRYVVFKTFKLFPYVPDDVDILVLDNDVINDVVSKLAKRGFKIRSKGTPEVTISKVAYKTFVDLDIHFKIAAGEYMYYPSNVVWQNKRRIVINGVKLNVVAWEDECIITMAHAVMKEFEVLASDILQFMLCKRKGYIIPERLERTGHLETYSIFSRIYKTVIQNNDALPYKIPLVEVALAYVYNIVNRIRTEGLRPVHELTRYPKARGIKRLVYRMV